MAIQAPLDPACDTHHCALQKHYCSASTELCWSKLPGQGKLEQIGLRPGSSL